jgi:hypothetical protein
MTTPQDPPVRNKQKRRRTKKLAEWREKQAKIAAKAPGSEKKAAEKAPAAKTAAKPAKKSAAK